MASPVTSIANVGDSVAPVIPRPQSIRSLSSLLLYGSATLGVAVGLERVCGFLASVLAARVAGPQTFGAYSMVLATAGTIAAYAGAGIGTTATRFSGEYKPESAGYRKFVLALAIIAIASATLAALLMFAGAGPLARWVLRNEAFTSFFRIAAISSAAVVLLECVRGFLVGQQKFPLLLALSVISGVGMMVVLPLAARLNAGWMILGQALIALVCVLVCLILAAQFGLAPKHRELHDPGPGIRPIFTFGLVQMSAFAGVSIASWWMASLVARSDVTLTQMGLYAIANQFRGLAAIAPGLFAQVGYAFLTNESGSPYGGAGRVTLVNSFVGALLATTLAIPAIVFAPWLLTLIYSHSFAAAEAPLVILLATAVVHMTGIPAGQRLSIVGLRAMGFINAIWAVLTIVLGIGLVPRAGATGAALVFLVSHILSQSFVIVALKRLGELPQRYLTLFGITTAGSFVLAAVAFLRVSSSHPIALTGVLGAIGLAMLAALFLAGRRAKCFPELSRLTSLFKLPTRNDLARS